MAATSPSLGNTEDRGNGEPVNATQFEHLVASVEDYAIFTMDRTGRVLTWNRGAERIKLYNSGEIVGRNFECFYLEEDKALGLPELELETALKEGKISSEGWRLRKDGQRFWAGLTITAVFSDDGSEFERFVKITRDLTERMLAAEALRQSEERFRLMLESVTDYAIFMLDTEGHVMSWNAGARKLKGYEAAEIIGSHFSRFYPVEIRESQAPALLAQALRDGRAENEGWRLRKDGTMFWGNVIITAVRDARGELRGFAKATRDLTDRREADLLRETDKKKDVFLATLAHELRNPLAPMLFGLEMLKKNPDNAEIALKVIPTLHRQVAQMAHLIDDLMDMSRVNTGKVALKKTRGLLSEAIGSAVEAVRPSLGGLAPELTVHLPTSEIQVEADMNRLTQIITNLLSNAAKFTPAGGKIVLEAVRESRTAVRIAVSDTGKGISPEQQGRIFEMFEQADVGAGGGLGIGLTLVKALTELHGGSVSVTSAGVGKGSEFQLLLPIAIPEERSSQAADGAAVAVLGGAIRVLVADDNHAAAEILAMFFQVEGMEAAIAHDGLEAVEIAESFRPHLVCMDLGMPNMNGFEAARRIRARNSGVVLVALSGWGGEEDRRRSEQAGFDDHLVKPVNPDDLRRVLAGFPQR